MKRGINKYAQVSIFIIVGVILVASGMTYYIIKSNNSQKENLNPNLAPIYSFVQDCINQIGEDATFEISKTGGYYKLPQYNINNVSYYFYNNKAYIPNKKTIENQLSLYVNDNLKKCLANFDNFNDFKITGTTIKTTSKIQDNGILFNVKYPLTITKENMTYQVSSFEETLDSRFPTMYLSSLELMQQQLNHTKSICLTCLNDLANKNDFYIEINYPDKKTVIFIILDNKTIVSNKTLIYKFAHDLK